MKVSTRGRICIPKELRERYGLSRGSEVSFVPLPDGLKIVPLGPEQDRFARFRGYLKGRWPKEDIDQYIRESRGRQ